PKKGKRADLTKLIDDATKPNADIHSLASQNKVLWTQYGRRIKDLRNDIQPPRDGKAEVIWHFGPASTGKTSSITSQFGRENCYIKDGTQWWDGYRQQPVIIIDDFDGKWPYRDLLRLLDREIYQGQVKGGYVYINSPHIFITCEYHPTQF